MKAVVYERYGPPDVLHIAEVDKPVPMDGQVLVRVHATTVNRTDAGLRSAELIISRLVTGLRRPKHQVLGMEFAGVVEAIGPEVTAFKVGDEVFGGTGHGAHAEFLAIDESGPLAHKPAGLSFEEAAPLVDGAELALACLRTAGPLEGRHVLVYGASGAVGSAAVQLAKHFGAYVGAVCSTRNVELVRSLGSDLVIDRAKEDFARNGTTYDVIFDAVGKTSFRRCRRSLKRGGTYVDTDLGFGANVPLLMLVTRWVGTKKVTMGITRYAREDVLLLKELVESGKFRAVIDRTYPLADVIEATRYVETERKVGNVVLTVADSQVTEAL
jgi:NADPH:quinone reductase-like Zn-dependent oxidoreductase